jgi:hypothetical protein
MPELPVKDLRLSELHLPEIKRDDIVRTLSERLPSIDLSAVELPGRDRRATSRFDWRSIDPAEMLAGLAAVSRFGRPLARHWRWGVAAGVVIAVGVATAAILARPDVRERAGKTAGKLRDKVQARMERGDVLELDDDLRPIGLPTEGELVTDEPPLPELGTLATEAPAEAASTVDGAEAPDEAVRPA